ncbi:hypothetical protein GW950_01290 [Candidatus Wolfebacteria bacterium]|nr:hypothetical protein [Candidatus Wolfebacteria bacterium]
MATVALTILVVVFITQLLIPKARFEKVGLFGGQILFLTALIIFGVAAYYSYQQYLIWSSSQFSQLFLPPYQDLDYFISYTRTRFFNPYILSLIFSFLFLLSTKTLNNKFGERFFENSEIILFSLALFLVGHPGWLLYLIIILFTVTLFSTFHFWKKGHSDRLSLYWFWLPVGIFTILISKWLSLTTLWKILDL